MSTVSVVIATYNGQKYIEEQLESIRTQTRTPDEVLICDDISTDGTVSIIKGYIAKYGLEDRWKLVENSTRLGCDRNFVEAAKASIGDIIFFADQDDIWYCEKIKSMTEVLDAHPKALGVTCLSDYVDSDGKKIKKLSEKFTTNLNSSLVQYRLSEQIKYNRSAGLEIAFRREIVNDLERMVIENDLKHDQPVGMISSLKGEYYGLNEKLLAHRIHTDNLSAPRISVMSRITAVDDQIEGNEEHLKHMKAFLHIYEDEMPGCDKEMLVEAIDMIEQSIDALKTRNLKVGRQLLQKDNGMVNKWILINNFLCIAFGKYSD